MVLQLEARFKSLKKILTRSIWFVKTEPGGTSLHPGSLQSRHGRIPTHTYTHAHMIEAELAVMPNRLII